MRKLGLLAAGALLAASFTTPALAHHSAAEYDLAHPIRIKGVIKEFAFLNPHARIVMHVKDEKGERDIIYEGHSRNNLVRLGLHPDEMKAGDEVTLVIAPRKDGADGGYMFGFVAADGEVVGDRSTN
jgi:hypothetical protein